MPADVPTVPPDNHEPEQDGIPWKGAAAMWKKGQSGNPKGRPKGRTVNEWLRVALDEEVTLADGVKMCKGELLARQLVNAALGKKLKPADRKALAQEIFNRHSGFPFQAVRDVEDGNDAEFNDQLRRMCESMGMPHEEKPDTDGSGVVC